MCLQKYQILAKSSVPEAPEELPERGERVEVRELVARYELAEDAPVEVSRSADEVADLEENI